METLKVALIDLDERFGGGQIALGNTAYALSRRGHEVHILLGAGNVSRRVLKLCYSRCHFHKIQGYSNLTQLRGVAGKARRRILRLHETCKFDVMNAQGKNGLLVPSQLQDRLVVTLHGNNRQRGLALLRFGCRSLEMRRAIPRYPGNFFRNSLGHFLYGRLEKIACERAKFVIALTPTEAYYARANYSISDRKIRVVPNAVTDLEDDSELLPLPKQERVVLSVGALEFIKGTPILTAAMRQILSSLDDVMYVSVGDGPLMPEMRELKALFPEKVAIFSQISTGLYSLYERSAMLVQASLYEALSLSMVEAMLAGKPVVAFKLASIPDLVADDVAGSLARPASPGDLAAEVLSLLESPEKTRNMGINARRIAQKLYSPDVVGCNLEKVLKEV